MKTSRLFLFSLVIGAALPVSGLLAQTAAQSPTPSVSAPASTIKADAEEDKEASREDKAAYANLSPEEQTKLRAARKAARKDPAVVAAEANRKADRKGYRQALQAAMLKADPSVGPIIEKMKVAHRANRKGA